MCCAGNDVPQVQACGIVAAPSTVAAFNEGTIAAANLVAALSAANDGVRAQGCAFVDRLTQLDEAVKERRVRRQAEDALEPEGARLSTAGSLVQEETERVTCMIDEIVGQVNCMVSPPPCTFMCVLNCLCSRLWTSCLLHHAHTHG